MDIERLLQKKEITMRHEEKFICSEKQLTLLQMRLKQLMPLDVHQKEQEAYVIRSLYFDTATDRFVQENDSGQNERNKYRIRIYNTSDQVIKLEKKTSLNNLKKKVSCNLTRKTVEQILNNRLSFSDIGNHPPIEEFFELQQTEDLRPKIIVEYDRTALVSAIGNVRITFDRRIRTSSCISDFFSNTLLTQPILPDNRAVLEVKYDGVLPGYIVRTLEIGQLQRISFSKYSLCRNLIENNGRIEEYYEF